MFNWKTDDGREIVDFVNSLRSEGLRNWNRIAVRVNDHFNIDFHSDKIRKGWREYGEKDSFVKSDESSATFKVEYNTGEASAKGSTIKTLDDLIKACEIDLEVWGINRHTINKWEVKAKDRDVFPLFQVKAWLSRIIPTETKFPVIQPVKINVSNSVSRSKEKRQYKRALIIPDMQIGFRRDVRTGSLDPFHDRKAMDLTIQIVADLSPDRIVLLGDCLDLPEFSDKFIKSPDFYWTAQPALVELSWFISRLIKAVPSVKIDYLAGNHEDRLDKSIINHLIAAYDLKPVNNLNAPPAMSIESLLGLSDLGVEYHNDYPAGEVWLNNNLRCRHGNTARKGGGNTSKAVLRDTFVSEVIGHSHRLEMSSKTVMTNSGIKIYTVFSPGTLSRIDGAVPSYGVNEDWQVGFGIIYYEEGDGDFQIIPISINDGRAIYNGNLYIGKDYVDQLKKDTGWDQF